MKMQMTLDNFPMEYFDTFVNEVNSHTQCHIQVGGEDTVFLACDANMIKCQIIVVICDRYRFGRCKDEN